MKLRETLKATSRGVVLAVLTIIAITSANAEQYDPAVFEKQQLAVSYEENMKTIYKSVTAKDEENYRLCKIFAEKGKEYKSLNRSDKFYDVTVKNCERRIKLYCGALMAAKTAEEKEAK